MCLVLAFWLLVPICAGADDNAGPGGKKLFTKHFQESLFDITEHAMFSVEVILDEKEYKIGKDVIGIVLHDDHDKDVRGATLMIISKDLQTGEQAAGPSAITDKGNGLYIVSGVDLKRKGTWELLITVKKDKAEDHVRFVFPSVLKERYPKGRYSP